MSKSCLILRPHCGVLFFRVFLVLSWLGLNVAQAQTATYVLGTSSLLVAPAGISNTVGSASVALAVTPANATWNASANASWLHLSAANQSGTGSANVVFTCDTNSGATRSGTLTIGGQTVTVTQAGLSYVAAHPVTTLVSSNLSDPLGIAVDGSGNVYFADSKNNAIKEWMPANNTVTNLVSSGLSGPTGVALDSAGNVYIADFGDNAIKEWVVASNNLITLVSSGLSTPTGIAVDGAGNVYFANYQNPQIDEWKVSNSNVVALVSGGVEVNRPTGVAVDIAGNVFWGDNFWGSIQKWTAANGNVYTVANSENDLFSPTGVVTDGSGNVYFPTVLSANTSAILEWQAVYSGNNANFVGSLPITNLNKEPWGVAVDGADNFYFADSSNNAIKELSYAFVNPTFKWEQGLAAGSDSLPVVLPATANLAAPFAPTTDQPWLTVSGITNGVVTFSFTASSSVRTGHITLLGQSITIIQGGPLYTPGTTSLTAGPIAGTNSVVLGVAPSFATWTNTTNASWLHLAATNLSGAGSATVVFSYDANPGATRSGTLAIAGQTLTVTQAGTAYVAVNPMTNLVSSNLSYPAGVAVDGAGNVYIADTDNSAIKKWTVANNTVTTLAPQNFLNYPGGVAVDSAGNVYIADTRDSAIKEWTVANSNLITLVSSPSPSALAVDTTGNVYISDSVDIAIKEWTVANSNVITLLTETNLLRQPTGIAVDAAGNVYYADTFYGKIVKWTAATSNLAAVASIAAVEGIAVDGSGNIYAATGQENTISKWTAATGNVTTLVSSGLSLPYGVAVDGNGNIYIADMYHNAIKELVNAYLDPTTATENPAAGIDALPGVLPVTENLLPPFAPTSDQSWLTITGIANGVVSFSFTANTGATNRTAHIKLFGQTNTITQTVGVVTPPALTSAQMLGNGAFQFSFANVPNGSFRVWTTTNLTVALSNWVVSGSASNIAPGQFQFTSPSTSNSTQRFYRVTSP